MEKRSGLFKTTVITVIVSVALSIGAQALIVWRNDSLQNAQGDRNSSDIKKLDDKKLDKDSFQLMVKQLEEMNKRIGQMSDRIDRLSDKRGK